MNATDLTILSVIESKLPAAIYDDATAMAVIVNDVFIEMETCLRRRFYIDPLDLICKEDWARVGDETLYNPIEKSIIGDFAAWRFCVRKMLEKAAELGLSISVGAGGRMIEKAKAGSAEADFKERDIRNNPFIVQIGSLISQLWADVMRKSRNIGCIIDVNADGVYRIELENNLVELPMIIVKENCNCGHGFAYSN